jgi:hypothetical protein
MTPQVPVIAQPAATTRPPAGSRLPMRSQPAQGCQEAPRVSRMSRVPSLAPAQRPQPLSPRPLLRQLTDAGAGAEPLRLPTRTGLERRLHLARCGASRAARCRRPASSLCLRDPRVVAQSQPSERLRRLALHCADRTPEHVGRRDLGEILVVPKNKNSALSCRQGGQQPPHRIGEVGLREVVARCDLWQIGRRPS